MLRFFASVFLITGFFLAGKWASSVQEKRVEILNEIMLMLNITESRLRYSHLPVTDLLRSLCENTGLSGLRFIKSCLERICFGEPFPDAWRKSIEDETEFCRLLSEVSASLADFGADIGSTDLESQLSGCACYKELVAHELELQREKSVKYKKLFPPLGLMLGISAAIIVI